jgi:hypothetical protein
VRDVSMESGSRNGLGEIEEHGVESVLGSAEAGRGGCSSGAIEDDSVCMV